ncbi:ABC-type dipeptide/oligopeptide/nickel transport system, permease component [Caldisphaera lagunensis DSM 15908]|uniref:ABC-type dipeptide/oligopeptide/nickel transport system, permease component n=1 Tax=Caldisphaera lagunensis (strain DSM 15908 / JCM 11604 / ANMR 0165 / IC-154) TaxID=1056495 RepID=L0AA98_CALLD|nr:ABC transporter permease [Caldisphaera lagunensis]AFZ70791.1 ABC-type dipeptide/oligopeptide/nickel transport system, permease component [Caldisphaera lagunensis DSM 15908]
MSNEVGIKSYINVLIKNKSGLIGIIMIIIYVILSIYGVVNYGYVSQEWKNIPYWETYPKVAQPAWMSIFNPSKIFTTVSYTSKPSLIYSGNGLNIYQITYNFTWNKDVPPSDVVFYLSTNGSLQSLQVLWIKPNGNNFTMSISSSPGNINDLVSFSSSIQSYIATQVKTVPSQITAPILSKALFGYPGPNLLNGTAMKGTYKAVVTIISSQNVKILSNRIYLEGNAYGLFGTDIDGRPLDLGILLGFSNALEIGLLTSIISVIGGVIVGGISGYLGGKVDSGLNWLTLVILVLPALPFLVVLSFVMRPNLLLESLLIAFLSWPFYAIIARSAAQSIKNEVFVEADKVLGIPSYRTFLTHFMPRLTPFAIAYTALGVPAAIILVQTLAFLGLAPYGILTWGTILNSAESNFAAVNGWWWWILFPGIMIILVSIPFVMIGFAIEKAIFGGK